MPRLTPSTTSRRQVTPKLALEPALPDTKRAAVEPSGAVPPPWSMIVEPSAPPRAGTKLDRLLALLLRAEGASLAELGAVTGWQAHSVRSALAGSLKRKGHAVISERIDGTRRYRIEAHS